VLADRAQEALWSGRVKHGNRWTTELRERLRDSLRLDPDDELLLTSSGTEALRLAVVATVGPARGGERAVLPSFTYTATAEVLVQLGYTLRFADVDEWTWTLNDAALASILAEEPAAVVVCVDTFGNPCDYGALGRVCADAGVPLVADSAAALGSLYRGQPVGTQADAHAFSMSFAKVLSAAGAGGAGVLRGGSGENSLAGWTRSALMDELHAAAALDQLTAFEELVARRQAVASVYARAASRTDGIVPQRVAEGDRHSFVHWVARFTRRERVARELARLGVETRDYFRALHLQAVGRGAHVRLPATERLDREVLALPISSELTEEDADAVAVALELALGRSAPVSQELLSEVGQHVLLRQPTLK
jgi:dTDP-4-amino-4,6-dideoxygalactose transaminase